MSFEDSVLYKAILAEDEDEVTKLLDAGEDTNVRDKDGKTLLHMALLKIKSVNIFKSLLEKVDDFSIRDEEGNSAADLLFSGEFPDEGETILKEFLAKWILKAHPEKLEELLLKGWIDLWPVGEEELKEGPEEVKEFMTRLPGMKAKIIYLHRAIREGNERDVKSLLDRKSLIKAADRTGLPPLHKAVVLNHPNIVQELASEFKDHLDLKDHMCRTALHYAGGSRDGGYMYKMLKDAGADESITDLTGKTPQEYYETPDLLATEMIQNKVVHLLDRPVLTSKVREEQQEQQGQEDQQTQATETEQEQPQTDSKPATPTARVQSAGKPKRVNMYITSAVPDTKQAPPPTTVDGQYVSNHLGGALTMALAEIAERRPWDPVEYLAHWLYKYAENQNHVKRQEELLQQIREEEEERERQVAEKARRRAELAQIQEQDRQRKEAEEEERKRKEQEEIKRKAKEAALSLHTGLETVAELEEEKEETGQAKDRPLKDEHGQTELHKLASQSAADLTTLLKMGYSPADRDFSGKTARDIAEESGMKENVEAIDNYVKGLVESGELEPLQTLLLEGYDHVDDVIDQVRVATTLTDDSQQFASEIPNFKERIQTVLQIVRTGSVRDVSQALERKRLIQAKDTQGRSPLHLAVLSDNKDVVEHLVTTFPTAVKCADNLNRTPLHYAYAISDQLVPILEANGADTAANDVRQRTPSYYKENPEDILTMKNSLSSPPQTTQEADQSQQEDSSQQQQEGQAQQEEQSQQEAVAE